MSDTSSADTTVYEIPVRRIDGTETSLGELFRGDVVLVVNVASKCGLTPQYEGLEKMYASYRDKGLVIAGFPCNDFAGQEPGTNEEIEGFCKMTFGVDFPLFEKVTVVGPEKHPLYEALIEAQPVAKSASDVSMRDYLAGFLKPLGQTPNPEPEVLWNFEKFLIGRDGTVVGRFSPDVTPDAPILVAAVEAEIAKG